MSKSDSLNFQRAPMFTSVCDCGYVDFPDTGARRFRIIGHERGSTLRMR